MTEFESFTEHARILCAKGNWKEGLHAYTEACRSRPESAQAWCNLGAASLVLKQVDRARDNYLEALKREPGYSEAVRGLAKAQLALGETQDALTTLTSSPSHPEDAADPELNYLRGIAYERLNRIPEARKAFKVALESNYPPAQSMWPRFLLTHSHPEAALRACFDLSPHARVRWQFSESVLENFPQHPAVYDLIAELFLNDHQYAYATRTTARALQALDSLCLPDWPSLQTSTWS